MILRSRNVVLLLVLVALSAAAAAVGAVVLYLRGDRAEWTSSSPAAVKELEAGLDDYRKVYYDDAFRHFHRAAELDEEFAAPRAMMSRLVGGERREALAAELQALDRERLTPRERFLVDLAVTRAKGDEAAIEALVEAYVERHPDDVWGIAERCQLAWIGQDWDVAERCYEELIAAHPNWVVAQNILGYIDMARGRFSEAEDHFRTYRFIAPDQANPYDSLGELLTLLGRYEEAEETLEQGLEVKPDFCASYRSLGRLYFNWGKPEALRQVAERLAGIETCHRAAEMVCRFEAGALILEGQPEQALGKLTEECLGPDEYDPLAYLLALDEGDDAALSRLDAALDAHLEKLAHLPKDQAHGAALRDHLHGVRALFQGRPREAVALLDRADEGLDYQGDLSGGIKLGNRLFLAFALRAAGEEAAAEAALHKIAAVNPRYLESPFLVEMAQSAVSSGRP